MNNDDLLKQIEKLFEVEREQTRRLIREETEPINKRLSGLEQGQKELEKRLTAKIETVDKNLSAKIETVDKKVEAFNQKLDLAANEIKETIERGFEEAADKFSDTFEKLDKQEEIEKRLERVEKHLHLGQL